MLRSSPSEFNLARTAFTGRAERKVRLLLDERLQRASAASVTVGVSGGPDSSALAVILARLSRRFDLHLTIAHFDHGLRSRREAVADARYVSLLADTLGLALVCGRGDVPAHARRLKTSREDAARRLRYEFLGRVASETHATAVAVGHTLDDRAETILMHILRGTGLSGLASMEPTGSWPCGDGPSLWRPLLALTRAETVRYCRETGLHPRADPTNRLPVATRNVVRSRLIPVLRKFNPRIEEALARLGEAAAIDAGFIDAEAGRAYADLTRPSRDGVKLSRNGLSALHPALRNRVIIRAALDAGATGTVQALHIAQVAALLETGGRTPLPGGLVAEVRRDEVWIHRAAEGVD